MFEKLKKYLSFYFQLFGFDIVFPHEGNVIELGYYGVWVGQFESFSGMDVPRCLFLLYYSEGSWQLELFWKRVI